MKVEDLKKIYANTAWNRFLRNFWKRVNKNGPIVSNNLGQCWEWCGPIDKNGYGQVSPPGISRSIGPHRASWLITYGEIPDGDSGLVVLHRCDNRKCVRIEHLSLGSQMENIRDMHQKQRARVAFGEYAGKAKLTWDEVREMRKRHGQGENQASLAKFFGVTPSTVSLIVRDKMWTGDVWKGNTILDS